MAYELMYCKKLRKGKKLDRREHTETIYCYFFNVWVGPSVGICFQHECVCWNTI